MIINSLPYLGISIAKFLNKSSLKKVISYAIISSFFIHDIGYCMEDIREEEKAPFISKPINHDEENSEEPEKNKTTNDPVASSKSPEDPNTPVASHSMRTAFSETLKFYLPYMISPVAVTANGIWNGYLYGRLGGPALQSEGVTLTYEFLIMGTAMGGLRTTAIFSGNLNKNAQDIINNEEDKIQKSVRAQRAIGNVNKTGFLLSCAYSALAIILFIEAGNIVQGIGLLTDPKIVEQTQNYFNGFVWGAAPTLFLFGDEQFSLGLKDPKAAGIFGSLYAGISSILAYPLAVGAWGFPELGVKGIGYAMSIGPWVSWLGLRGYFYFNKNEKYKDLKLYHFTFLKKDSFKTYLKCGVPLALTNSIGLVSDFFSSQFISGFSGKAASAYSAASAYFTQLDIVLLGYSAAISAQIANFDPRKIENVTFHSFAISKAKNHVKASIITSIGIAAACSVPALIWQDEFINFFAGEQPDDILNLTKQYLWFFAGQEVLKTYSNAVEGSLHGLRDIMFPFGIDVSTDMLSLGSIWVVSKYTDDPIWLVTASSAVCGLTALVYSGRLYSVARKVFSKATEIVTNIGNIVPSCWGKVSSWFKGEIELKELKHAFE